MKIELTDHPLWIKEFLLEIADYEDRILEGECFTEMAKGELPIDVFRQVMINFYPLIENFPKYMALILAKVPMEDSPEANMARHWLIHNLNIERLHAENPQGTVVIQADKESKTDTLIQVMDASRQAGVYNVSIAAQD